MPYVDVNGTRLYYEAMGTGKPVILFSHGLLWSGQMFAAQVNYFAQQYTCITYDHRGQGRSPDSPEPFDMETIYADAVALIEALGCAPCHFVGLSMGGFVGMRLAARRPDLLRSCILLATSADAEPHIWRYRMLNMVARLFGLRPVAAPVMKVLFGKTFLQTASKHPLRQYWQQQLLANRRSIVESVDAIIGRKSILHELGQIRIPMLILVGEEDLATPPEKSEQIKACVQHAVLHRIPAAGHSLSIESPEEVIRLMESFLLSLRPATKGL